MKRGTMLKSQLIVRELKDKKIQSYYKKSIEIKSQFILFVDTVRSTEINAVLGINQIKG